MQRRERLFVETTGSDRAKQRQRQHRATRERGERGGAIDGIERGEMCDEPFGRDRRIRRRSEERDDRRAQVFVGQESHEQRGRLGVAGAFEEIERAAAFGERCGGIGEAGADHNEHGFVAEERGELLIGATHRRISRRGKTGCHLRPTHRHFQARFTLQRERQHPQRARRRGFRQSGDARGELIAPLRRASDEPTDRVGERRQRGARRKIKRAGKIARDGGRGGEPHHFGEVTVGGTVAMLREGGDHRPTVCERQRWDDRSDREPHDCRSIVGGEAREIGGGKGQRVPVVRGELNRPSAHRFRRMRERGAALRGCPAAGDVQRPQRAELGDITTRVVTGLRTQVSERGGS